ncbi:MAG: CheY-like chemotaxis protein [Myxococcota bacterium]
MAQGERDLILMDCHMPNMDGFRAAHLICERLPDAPPIVALSASALDDDRRRCIDAGMVGFISKPIDPMSLQVELARLLPALCDETDAKLSG